MRSTRYSVADHMRHAIVLAGMSLALSSPLVAGIDIPDLPLEVGSAVPSNLMFILDDSGSMQWEVMPDALIHQPGNQASRRLYLFPLPANGSNVYQGTNYQNRVHDFNDDDPLNVIRRSSHNNTTFYNPGVIYQPWLKADGSSFGNVSPTAAPYNPAYSAAGTLDLTVEQNQLAIWDSCASGSCWRTFYPITFYMYKGSGSVSSPANYVRYQIRGNSGFRKDLSSGTETAVATFAWPGGIGRSVAQERQNFANWFSYYRSRILAARAGTSIAFAGLSQDNFRVGFRTINNNSSMNIPIIGTFSGTNRAAWFDMLFATPIHRQTTPLRNSLKSVGEYFKNSSDGGPWGPAPQLECRRSFAILTSDGFWNDGSPGVGNADGSAGSPITGPDGQSYTYAPEKPYNDSYSNTLADVAMTYWKQDLRPNLTNRLRPTPTNPAFWQHMSTFTLSIGVQGTLDPENDLAELASGAKSWPDPASGDAEKIDDMWHAAVNGRGIFVAAQNPQEFADGLKKALDAIGREGSVMNVAVTSAALTAGAKVFKARYDGTWGGDLAAYPVSTETNRASSTPAWTASEQLPASHASRKIWTRVGGVGKQFLWGNLDNAQQEALDDNPDVLDFLRGDRDNEMSGSGSFRTRSVVIGDIVNSSPVYVAETNTVYVGANDGMLHAFNASSGAELFAYVPASAYPNLGELADPNYSHRFFVDGELAVSSKAQGGKNILVGSLGRGGKSLFALDVSNPASFGAGNVLWEFTDAELGQVIGKPVIVKLNNGNWAVMVGNGYNSGSDRAYLFLIDLVSGSLIKKIDTGAGSAADPNGLAQPIGWDADGNGIVDTAYAGDLHGNMWRFDLSKNGSGAWGTDGKLFVATNAGGNKAQPITGAPAVATNPNNGDRWVIFGTGRFLSHSDKTNQDVQSWYGVIDDGNNTVGRDALYERKIEYVTTTSGRRVRVFSAPDDEATKTAKGWVIDWTLPGGGAEGERVVSRAQYIGGVVVVSSIIPEDDPCLPGGRSYLNQVTPFIGHFSDRSFFDVNDDGLFDDNDMIAIGGQLLPVGSIDNPDGMMREVAVIGDRAFTGTDDIGVNLALPTGRISWHELVAD